MAVGGGLLGEGVEEAEGARQRRACACAARPRLLGAGAAAIRCLWRAQRVRCACGGKGAQRAVAVPREALCVCVRRSGVHAQRTRPGQPTALLRLALECPTFSKIRFTAAPDMFARCLGACRGLLGSWIDVLRQ